MTVRACASVLTAVLVALCSPAAAQGAADGERVFSERCASCHALAQQDGSDRWLSAFERNGPPLTGAGDKFNEPYLKHWLTEPASVRGGSYPYFRWTVPTPDGDRLPVRPFRHVALGPGDAQAVAAFLATQHAEMQSYPPVQPVSATVAKVLFDKVAGGAGCQPAQPGAAPRSRPRFAHASERLNSRWLESYLHDPQQSGTLMMPKSRLRADQVAGLVHHVSYALPQAESEPPQALPPVPAGVSAPEVNRNSRGALIYRVLCTQCHGLNGDGRGINAKHLSVAPRNHRSREMATLSDEHLYRVIRYGGTSVDKSALMPSWGSVLREDEINDVVAHLRELGR